MNSTSFNSRQPRRGQALLLAVLIMIFAALLSASFIAVVSVNLNQTARQTDKNRSVVAARAGLDHVRHQLAYSPDGDKWRNELENVPPAPGDPDYAIYYTPLEIAQGWARTTLHPTTDFNGNGVFYPNAIDPEDERIALSRTRDTGKLELVKSPDPRNVAGQIGDIPTYLSQVQRVPFGLPLTNPDYDKAGALKITVVGLSSEDPTAYTRSTAYFGGFKNAPVAQMLRTVFNWDYKNNLVPTAQVATFTKTDPAAPTITFQSSKDSFLSLAKPLYASLPALSAQPFTITVSNPRLGGAAGVARSVVVRDVSVNTVTTPPTYTLTLATPAAAIIPDPAAGDRIELAANLGAPSNIQATNLDYGTAPTPTPIPVKVNLADTNTDIVSTATPDVNQVDGARVNGSLIYSGILSAARLRPISSTYGPSGLGIVSGTILASGVIAPDISSTATINIAGGTAISDTLKGSDATGVFASSNIANQNQLVSDGWNLLAGKGINVGSRNVPTFQPPVIESGEGVERYRRLSRLSAKSINPTNLFSTFDTSSALYGYGQGIYIDNTDDVEKVSTTTGFRAMTQTELLRLWQSPYSIDAANDKFSRVAGTTQTTPAVTIVAPAVASLATASLEERHLTGWVGPDEFRPRGPLVELDFSTPTSPKIIITRDSRSDLGGAVNAFGAADSKTWKNPQGNPLRGVYRQEFAWPSNGVLFAEGNLRIRGGVTDPDGANKTVHPSSSLTVVSMGNIYVEGSLNAGGNDPTVTNNRKILLLARKNVVCNPTRVVQRVDAQTRVSTAAGGAGTAISVYDGASFKVGDAVMVGDAPTAKSAYITAIAGNSLTLSDPAVAAAATVNAPVRALSDRDDPSNTAAPFGFKDYNANRFLLENTSQVFQRHFNVPAATVSTRITFRHSALSLDAMTLQTKKPTDPPGPGVEDAQSARFANKLVDFNAPAPFITPAQKLLSVAYKNTSDTEEDEDLFPATPATLGALVAEMTAKYASTPGPATHWQYLPTVSNAAYKALPFYALTSYGNRKSLLPIPIDTGLFPPSTGGTATDYDVFSGWRRSIPDSAITPALSAVLGTSVGINLNDGTNPNLFRYTGETTGAVKNFGFSPVLTDNDDTLSIDRTFYTTPATDTLAAGYNGYTLQSLVLAPQAAQTNTLSLRLNSVLAPLDTVTNAMPAYRMSNIKLENEDVFNTSGKFNQIKPAQTLDIRAYVYAQEGSWFVIPGGYFDSRTLQSIKPCTVKSGGADVSGFYLDVNNDGQVDADKTDPTNWKNSVEYAIYNNGTTSIVVPDLNRDGVGTEDEQYEAVVRRFSRYNYQINFVGAIAENQTALVNNVGTVKGAVADWMDKWATSSMTTAITPLPLYGRIHYVFDPTVALGKLNDDPNTPTVDETDYGFRLPFTPDVFNVS